MYIVYIVPPKRISISLSLSLSLSHTHTHTHTRTQTDTQTQTHARAHTHTNTHTFVKRSVSWLAFSAVVWSILNAEGLNCNTKLSRRAPYVFTGLGLHCSPLTFTMNAPVTTATTGTRSNLWYSLGTYKLLVATECLVCNVFQQEEQALKRSILAILTGLLWSHLPCQINYCKCLGYFMQLYNRMTTQTLAFL